MSEAAFPASPDIGALWEAYAALRDRRLRDELLEQYLPMAKRIAGRLYRLRWDEACPFDDYLQYARLGLLEAIERFEPQRRIPFEAFCGHRIRGAVLNGLARESEAAAQQRQWRRSSMQERIQSLGAAALEHPQRASLDDIADLTIGLALGLLLEGEADEEPIEESVPANPYAAAEWDQLRERLRASVERLPEREREIVKGHYYELCEFQAIAQQMDLTKGRISQLHVRALARIREFLESHPRIDCQL